jgi:hypothetical protein
MSRRFLSWTALAVMCALSVVIPYRLFHPATLDEPFGDQSKYIPVSPGELAEPVCTDKHRRVQLFRVLPLREPTSQKILDAREDIVQRLKLVRTAPADQPCNCYGWVFANGEYWMAWQDVEMILEDNGYSEVTSPKAGDLVIYRNQYGALIHAGIVRSSDAGDAVEIESQWGEMGRFRHGVDSQLFSDIYGYFRSARRGHMLSGFDRDSQPAQEIEE